MLTSQACKIYSAGCLWCGVGWCWLLRLAIVVWQNIRPSPTTECMGRGMAWYNKSVYKSGMKLDTNNYRGITVLSVYEKVFELAVQRRLEFVNCAFEKADRHNGGFASGNRTSDNIFILHGLIQRQLSLGQPLIVIFVDFTKAFDLVNRNILIYKLMENGFFGRVLDTLRNLYSKTHFRVKHKG